MSQLIEEKSNKIIEVIAAAVPIDAMFVGKLFAMLAASVIGIMVWLCAGALFIQMIKHGGVATLPVPAIGWPGFLALVVVYFATNYLLIGAIMLTIGAQASTAREVQVLAMPATFGAVACVRPRRDGGRRTGFAQSHRRGDFSAVFSNGDARPRGAGSAIGGRTFSPSCGRPYGSGSSSGSPRNCSARQS